MSHMILYKHDEIIIIIKKMAGKMQVYRKRNGYKSRSAYKYPVKIARPIAQNELRMCIEATR